MENENGKRTRDENNDDNKEILKNKKQDIMISTSPPVHDSLSYDEKDYALFDDIGIFDFPWLKEGGVIVKGDEYLDVQDTFAPCSCLDEVYGAFDNVSCVQQNLLVSPPIIDDIFKDDKSEDESLRSFKIDDLEPVDCVWSSIINQPLDIGLNKA